MEEEGVVKKAMAEVVQSVGEAEMPCHRKVNDAVIPKVTIQDSGKRAVCCVRVCLEAEQDSVDVRVFASRVPWNMSAAHLMLKMEAHDTSQDRRHENG